MKMFSKWLADLAEGSFSGMIKRLGGDGGKVSQARCPGQGVPGKVSQARCPRQGVLGKVS